MKTEIKTKIMQVTPEQAEKWLAASPGNRRIKPAKVAEYSAAIGAGRWTLNGERLAFDDHGKLMNGHHRLHACIKACRPFTTEVVFGLDRATMSTIDTGVRRSLADQQAMCPIESTSAPRPARNVNAVNGALRVAAKHFGGRGWMLADYDASVTPAMFDLADVLVPLLAGKAYPNLRLRSGAGIVGALVFFATHYSARDFAIQVASCLKHGPELKNIPGPAKRAAEKIRTFLGAMDHAEKEQVAFEITLATLIAARQKDFRGSLPSHRTVERMRAWALEVLEMSDNA